MVVLTSRWLGTAALLLLGHAVVGAAAGGFDSFREVNFRRKVDAAIKRLKLVLDNERSPQYPADVSHNYEDKYLLAELASRAAVGSFAYILDALPGWTTQGKEVALGWKQARRGVTLRFSYCERCNLAVTATKEVEAPTKQVVERSSTWGFSNSKEEYKMVTTVVEHTWNFDTAWELSIFPGMDHGQRTFLVAGGGRAGIKTTASPGTTEAEKPSAPFDTEACAPPLELDIGWMLDHLHGPQPDFSINRTSEECRTPRRNADIDAALDFFKRAAAWTEELQAKVVAGVRKGQQEPPNFQIMDQVAVFEPVSSLFVLEEREEAPALVLSSDFHKVLQEFGLRMTERSFLFQSKFPAEAQGGLVTQDAALVLGALSHVRSLTEQYHNAVNAIEAMLRDQLVSAIGKEIGPIDFAEYMEFHNLRLFRPEYKPRAFSYAVRQPDHYPEGVVSIEARLASAQQLKPIQTMVMHSQAQKPMRFALNAAMELSFLGERYVHACLLHHFREQGPPSMQLVARARQFSSYVLLVGKIQAADLFEPTSALIIKDKDDLLIPLLLETIPTPKEFRDAIESLSPDQQRFAKAFREMQLSSSLFGLCIIQIKPQMERLLNLPGGALTKEIQLTQDLMELFIRYQVSSDLLSYDGPDTTSGSEKLEAVQRHVAALQATIGAARKKELAEEDAKAHKAEAAKRAKAQEEADSLEREIRHDLEMNFNKIAPFGKEDSAPELEAKSAPQQRWKNLQEMGGDDSWDELGADDWGLESATLYLLDAEGPVADRTSHAPAGTAEPGLPAGQAAPAPAEAPVSAMAAGQGGNSSDLDYMMLPKLMDQRFEFFDDDDALRSTKISLGTSWSKSEQPGLLSPPKKRSLHEAEQRVEHDQAFDLLDALSRSGALPVHSASLHVVLAATHSFDQTLIETVVQDNINPIDKVERSSLLMASTLHGQPVSKLVAPAHLEKAQQSSPKLFAKLV